MGFTPVTITAGKSRSPGEHGYRHIAKSLLLSDLAVHLESGRLRIINTPMALVGEVTPGSVYAHIDQSLGTWSQRPVFKTNVRRFVSLRQVQPPLALADLRRISEFFPDAGFEFQLDPAYEPTDATNDPDRNAVFAILQKYNRVNLLIPVGAPHMWYAAMDSKTVKLTALGEHYRRLAANGLI